MPTVLARWFVPRVPAPRRREAEWGYHDFNQWCRAVQMFASSRRIQGIAGRCRVEAVVRVADGTLPPRPSEAELAGWRESIATTLQRLGLIRGAPQDVSVTFEPSVEPDLLARPRRTGTEITIVDACQF